MPTGYTAAIGEGKGITFEKFILQCARAFGACIEMRDEPMDKPIPDEFKPSDYSKKQLAEANKLVEALDAMTDAECAKKARSEYDESVKYHKEGIAKNATLKSKYEEMLAKVEAWTPPSPDHEGLKKFMREQIAESIQFDCGGSYHADALNQLRVQTGAEWRKSAIEKARKDIAYHSKSQAEENERAAKRTLWVRQLRESI